MDTLMGVIREGVYQEVKVDELTQSLLVVQSIHNQIHLGNHYFFKTWLSLTGLPGTTIYFAFKTAAAPRETHAFGKIGTSRQIEIEIFYDAIVEPLSGTPVLGVNNRMELVDEKPHEMLVYAEPTVLDEGISFYNGTVDKYYPVTISDYNSYSILTKQDTQYLWKIVKLEAAPHWVDIDFWWFENEKETIS